MRTLNIRNQNEGSKEKRKLFIYNPEFWSIIFIFILITMHHYDNTTMFRLFARYDMPLGLTRHSVDRILYLIPIILSSIVFGFRGGIISLVAAFAVMLPRALLISTEPTSAFLETLAITLVGGIAPIWADHQGKHSEKLLVTMEQLETTQRELDSMAKVSMERKRQLAITNAFSTILSQSLELDEVMQATVDMVMSLMDVDVVLIFVLDDNNQELRLVAHRGVQQDSANALDGMKLGQGICGRVAKTGKPINIDDVSAEPEFCTDPVSKEKLITELSVPLIYQSKIMGTLCVATRFQKIISGPDVELLSALGNLIGVAIAKAQLYTEREAATEQLTVSEKKYRQLFENAHDAIWVQDYSGKITAANEASSQLFQQPLKELIGTNIHEFIEYQEAAGFDEYDGEIDESAEDIEQYEPYMKRVVRKNGSEAFIMLTTNLISSDGQANEVQFIGRDITKEVRMQENQGFYLKQITKAHEEERLRISRDLHDSTAQTLIAMVHQLETFCRNNSRLTDSEAQFLKTLQNELKESLRDIRQISRDLRPSILDDLGLMPAVEWLIEQLKKDYNIDGELIISGEERRFTPETQLALFRIIQEALRNIAKHAEATSFKVVFEHYKNETVLAISDNGIGFHMPAALGELSRAGKLGIDGMQTRARLIGGSFDMYSEEGRGTTIVITIPQNNAL